MNKYLLIKLVVDWADEFDTYSLWITTEKRWNKFLNKLKESGFVSCYFGTNEKLEFDSVDSFLQYVSVTELTSKEKTTLVNLLEMTETSIEGDFIWGNCTIPYFDKEYD